MIIFLSIQLFITHFPIGSGAATFGSLLSEDSAHYKSIGLDISSKYIQSGIYDSNLATIIGELGLVGVILFVFLFQQMYSTTKKFSINTLYHRTLIVTIIIFAATFPVIVNGFSAMLFALALNLNPRTQEL